MIGVDPEGAARCESQSPRIGEIGVGESRRSRHIRVEIGLHEGHGVVAIVRPCHGMKRSRRLSTKR